MRRVRVVPAILAAVLALVLLTALVPKSPVRDAVTGELVREVTLNKPTGYVVMSPLSEVLDTLTLLSARQHIAVIASIFLLYVLWWFRVGRATLVAITPARRALREGARIGVGLVILAAIYVAAAVMPRPMASLEASSNIAVVDFHAHTKYSHDGRPGWTANDVRVWHHDAGFGIAYITDHRTFEGAREGWANNAERAGEGTLLIPGIEVGWRGEHVNVLDADRMYQGILTETLRDVDESALALASLLPNNEPVVIETIPGDPAKIVAAKGVATMGVRALEIVDGSPRGLGQSREQRAQLIHYADSTNIALVAGSDNHGWGRTASAWTLMSIREWRAAPASDLSVTISRILRNGRRNATRVVERYVPDTDAFVALPFTIPLTAWALARTLTGEERIVWLVWLMLFFLLWRSRQGRRITAA